MSSLRTRQVLAVSLLSGGLLAVASGALPRNPAPASPPQATQEAQERPVPLPPVREAARPPQTAPSPPPRAGAGASKARPQPKEVRKSAKKDRQAAAKKQRVAQRRPTESECGQMSSAKSIFGRENVIAGGVGRGYSRAQVERALRDCSL